MAEPTVPFTNSVSPLDEKTAKTLGNVVDPRRKEAGRGREEEAKGSKEEDDKRQNGRKGEEDLDQEEEETAEGKDEDGCEQPGAILQAGLPLRRTSTGTLRCVIIKWREDRCYPQRPK